MYKVKVENLNQFEIVLSSKDVSEIILSRDSFAEPDLPKLVNKIKKAGKLAWILMERISRYEETMKPGDLRLSTDKIYNIKNLDGIIIQNLDSFAYMLRKINKAANEKLKVELNYTMNCYNAETKLVHENLYNEKRKNASEAPLLFTAPVELNTYELSEVGYDTIIAYSYIDTMVTANCLRKNTDIRRGELREPACKYKFNYEKIQDFSSYIIDRKGKKLHYKTYCKYCYNKIFNTEPLYLLDKIDELMIGIFSCEKSRSHSSRLQIAERNAEADTICHKPVGADTIRPDCKGELCEPSIRIDFSFESEKEVRNILNKKIPESFTRGHIKTSIK